MRSDRQDDFDQLDVSYIYYTAGMAQYYNSDVCILYYKEDDFAEHSPSPPISSLNNKFIKTFRVL